MRLAFVTVLSAAVLTCQEPRGGANAAAGESDSAGQIREHREETPASAGPDKRRATVSADGQRASASADKETSAGHVGTQAAPKEPHAEDLWAKALLLAVPGMEAPMTEVVALFRAAIERAENKAPLYVSLADVLSGPKVLHEMLDELAEDYERETVKTFTAELMKEDLVSDADDEDATIELLRKTWQRSLHATARGKTVQKGIEAVTETATGESDVSIGLYLAALKENPRYLPAWYALCFRTEGEQQKEVVRRFAQLDPQNAIPCYFQAAIEAQDGRLQAALVYVQKGNARPVVRLYPPPVPDRFTLRFPDDKELRKYGVAGKPCPPSALEFLTHATRRLMSWADSVHEALLGLARCFVDEAKKCRDAGDLRKASCYLEATRQMGLALLRVEPPDPDQVIIGALIRSFAREPLMAVYREIGDSRAQASLEDENRRYAALKKRMFEIFDRSKAAQDADIRAILEGRRRPVAESRELMRRALKETRFHAAR